MHLTKTCIGQYSPITTSISVLLILLKKNGLHIQSSLKSNLTEKKKKKTPSHRCRYIKTDHETDFKNTNYLQKGKWWRCCSCIQVSRFDPQRICVPLGDITTVHKLVFALYCATWCIWHNSGNTSVKKNPNMNILVEQFTPKRHHVLEHGSFTSTNMVTWLTWFSSITGISFK